MWPSEVARREPQHTRETHFLFSTTAGRPSPAAKGGFRVNYLSYRRQELRIQQQELARRARINRALISGFENGRVIPKPAELTRLAEVLHVERPDCLMAQVRVPPPVPEKVMP
jgi:DNA-binding XRE family transcriptional regulator